jgi:hypothetical protein
MVRRPAGRAGRVEEPAERRRLLSAGRRHHAVGGDPVSSQHAARDLLLEEREGGLDAAIELRADGLEILLPAVRRVRQEVLRVVQQAHVEALRLQPLQRSLQLIAQELRVDAVPAAVHVADHLREGIAAALPLEREVEVLPLHVTDLRDHDDLGARARRAALPLREDGPDQRLASPVGVIGGGVDEGASGVERPLERTPVRRRAVVDAVAAEPDPAERALRHGSSASARGDAG